MSRTLIHLLPCIAALLPSVVLAEVYQLPPAGDDVIGAVTEIRSRADDTLLDIARRHGLGYEDIVRANPDVDTWLPGENSVVVLPTRFVLPSGPRRGVILNLAEYRMYYFPEPKAGEPAVVMTYPMSIGRMDWETPLGRTRVISKVTNPSWYPPASVRAEHEEDGNPLPRIVPPGPANPLGAYAMRLDIPGYLIHSTNRPAGVGMRVTHGCIRMYPEDIDFLFGQISVNTPVRIVNEPVKIGWHGDQLLLEAHLTLEIAPPPEPGEMSAGDEAESATEQTRTADAALEMPAVPRDRLTTLTELFVSVTSNRPGRLDWDAAELLLERASGIPEAVGRRIKNAATSAASE